MRVKVFNRKTWRRYDIMSQLIFRSIKNGNEKYFYSFSELSDDQAVMIITGITYDEMKKIEEKLGEVLKK